MRKKLNGTTPIKTQYLMELPNLLRDHLEKLTSNMTTTHEVEYLRLLLDAFYETEKSVRVP